MSLGFLILTQCAIASVNKKPKKIDLGLVRKMSSTDTPFKPITDPNKRTIEKERYSPLDMLEWQGQAVLDNQSAVTGTRGQYQQQAISQAIQSIGTFHGNLK